MKRLTITALLLVFSFTIQVVGENRTAFRPADRTGAGVSDSVKTGGMEIPLATRRLIAFEPYYYAVRHGRSNDTLGVGNVWYDRFCIMHISDVHRSATLLSEAIDLAAGRCDVIANTGDDGWASSNSTGEYTLGLLGNVGEVLSKGTGGIPYVGVNGNHDVPNTAKSEYFRKMSSRISSLSDVHWGDSANFRTYGYVDVSNKRETIRMVMLDMFDYPDGEYSKKRDFMTCTFSQAQVDWLIATLKDAVAKGYKVITMGHYSFGDNDLHFNEERAKPDAEFYQDWWMIPDIIDAMQHKTTLSHTYKDKAKGGTQDITVNEDFSDLGDLHFICHLFGHIHSKNQYRCQKTDGSKMYDILMLGEHSLAAKGTALNKVFHDAGTINEISLSILEIDTSEHCIYRVSYGAYMNYDNSPSSVITKIPYRF